MPDIEETQIFRGLCISEHTQFLKGSSSDVLSVSFKVPLSLNKHSSEVKTENAYQDHA